MRNAQFRLTQYDYSLISSDDSIQNFNVCIQFYIPYSIHKSQTKRTFRVYEQGTVEYFAPTFL